MNDFNIKIEYKHVPRFDSGSDESIDYLESEGYVIIKNALTAVSYTHLTLPTNREV